MKKTITVVLPLVLIALTLSACSELQLELPRLEPFLEGQQPTEPTSPPAPTPTLPAPVGTLAIGLTDLQAAYEQIYRQVLPSVISITVTSTVTERLPTLPDLPFDFNFPNQDIPREFQRRGAGSGFVWDQEGHIVTNYHVIAGADVIRVRFADGTSVLGELVGADTDSDLAVVKVDVSADLLKPVQLADSTQVQVGQIVVAIGSPFQLDGSMTTGIISGVGRSLPLEFTDGRRATYSIPDVIQTDAAINPGNSGGVLVDIMGRLIGVTTAIESPVRGNTGVGYVVPSVIVQKVVPILIAEGDYQHPYIGISGTDLTAELAELMDLPSSRRGALVIEVNPGSPADEADLQGSDRQALLDGLEVRVGGDIITSIDGQAIKDFEDLITYLARYTLVNQTVTLTLLRDGQEMDVELTLIARPARDIQTAQTPRDISRGGWLGVAGIDLTSEAAEAMGLARDASGVLVQQVTVGSPADEAGLRGSYKPLQTENGQILVGGDIITAVDESAVAAFTELSRVISSYEPGTQVLLTILRDGQEIQVQVRLGERPQ